MKKIIFIIISLNIQFYLGYGQEQCKIYEWKCKNNECIALDELCDGQRHCSDGSDEITESCIHLQCPKYSFKCSYGACVGGGAKCNNVKDCDDNSDEAPSICSNVETSTIGNIRTDCPEESFKCDNGDCISIDLACDGKYDCIDNSDEQTKLCSSSFCPAFAFRCGYGACINGERKCDGQKDCIDGSDESIVVCGSEHKTEIPNLPTQATTVHPIRPKPTKPTPDDGCRVTYVSNLIVQYQADNQEITPGEYVPNYVGVRYSCQKRHVLIGTKTNNCYDGTWSEPLPKCIKYCSNSVFQSITIQASCELNGIRVACHLAILPGTRATIACEFGYQKPNLAYSDYLICLDDGEWSTVPYRCVEVCGEEHPDFNTFILGGSKTNNTKVPWHVGIYSSLNVPNEQICGGTIVNARIVISAAHCFWNISNGRINDNSNYKVGAGKYYRDYYASEPLPVQFSDVAEIHVSEGYKDIQLSYINDIAVVVLKSYIKFTFYIKPACLKWSRYSEAATRSNLIGRVSGWGKTSAGIPSKELNTVELSTLSYDDCLSRTAREYQTLITGDKFCVGSKDGQTVCQGDSGGGFLIPINESGVQKFVLQGIVSNGINSNAECTGDFLTAYTNIQYFKQMVEDYMIKFTVQ